jgi:hypothetical protein
MQKPSAAALYFEAIKSHCSVETRSRLYRKLHHAWKLNEKDYVQQVISLEHGTLPSRVPLYLDASTLTTAALHLDEATKDVCGES